MMDDKKNDVIDLRVIISLLLQRKKLFVKVLIVTFVIASALILCVPRTYTCTVKLAPEAASATTGSALGSIASSLGFDLSNMESNDAIFPLLYPELFESNDFLVQLFDIRIKSLDGEINTTYYDYLELRGCAQGNVCEHSDWMADYEDEDNPPKRNALKDFMRLVNIYLELYNIWCPKPGEIIIVCEMSY